MRFVPVVLPLSLAITLSSAPARAGDPPPTESRGDSWLDSGHEFVSDRAQALVEWMDDFYGSEVADFETAGSRLRVRFEARSDETEDTEFKAKVRAKVQLPRLNKRLALIIEGDEGDDFDTAPGVADDDTGVGFQYGLSGDRDGPLRFDIIAAINSGPQLRTGLRLRFDAGERDDFYARWIQDVAYQTGARGAFTRTRLDFFQLIDEHNQLALINRLEYGEDTYGSEWNSSLQWRKRLSHDRALTYFVGADGVSDSSALAENYGFGINFRQNIFRDYLSIEIEPAHWWRKYDDWDSRQGVWALKVRFEVRFETPGERAPDAR